MSFWKRGVVTASLVAGSWALASCTPSGPSDISERDLVTTFYDQTADFGAIRTYAMPNEVVEREGSEGVSDAAKDIILSEVASQMARLGYRRELSPQTNGADVVILVSTIRQTREYWVSWPWWPTWGHWPGWGGWCCFGPGWGVSYPWVSRVQYTTGAIFVDMFDPNRADVANQMLPALWSAGIDGLVSSIAASNAERIVQTIDQAFRQSPYLGAQ